MYTEDDIRRLKWQSRRGMLELDVLFVPFVEEAFADLDEADQDRFVKLLAEEDQDLFVWLMEREVPQDPDLQRIVRIILERVQPTYYPNKTFPHSTVYLLWSASARFAFRINADVRLVYSVNLYSCRCSYLLSLPF